VAGVTNNDHHLTRGRLRAAAAKNHRSAARSGGRAEQKVPFEIMCLADAVRSGHASRAFLVLGGDGWTLRDYFTSGALSDHLVHAELVRIVTLEAFIRLANNSQL
jgi:hypothetical protein